MSEWQVTTKPIHSWQAALGSLLVFALVAPPIARLVWRLSSFSLNDVSDPTEIPQTNVADVVSALIRELPEVYLSLGVPFLLIGAFAALYGLKRGSPPLWICVAPVVVVFGGILLYDLVIPPPPDVMPWLSLLPALSGISAAVVCGLIVRRLW